MLGHFIEYGNIKSKTTTSKIFGVDNCVMPADVMQNHCKILKRYLGKLLKRKKEGENKI